MGTGANPGPQATAVSEPNRYRYISQQKNKGGYRVCKGLMDVGVWCALFLQSSVYTDAGCPDGCLLDMNDAPTEHGWGRIGAV